MTLIPPLSSDTPSSQIDRTVVASPPTPVHLVAEVRQQFTKILRPPIGPQHRLRPVRRGSPDSAEICPAQLVPRVLPRNALPRGSRLARIGATGYNEPRRTPC